MKKKRRGRRSGMGIVIITVVVMFGVITYNKVHLSSKHKELQEEKARCEQQLSKLQQEQEEIEAYREYVGSDENIEKIAREKLGLVYPGDIVFEAEDK